jgi:hypothetical protein
LSELESYREERGALELVGKLPGGEGEHLS